MKITTWNVNSVNARLPLIRQWVEAEQPDVIAFQEIKCIDEKFPVEAFESLGYQCAVHGQKSYNGVAVLSRHGLSDIQRGLSGDESDTASRYLEVLVEAPRPFRFASIYLPNGNPIGTEKYTYKMGWIDRLRARALELLMLEETTVLSGDYNIIPFAEDCHNPALWLDDALFQPEVRRAFQGLKNLGYTDAFDVTPPEGNRYTFWDYQAGAWPKNEGIRIDHHLLSPQAADRLSELIIHKSVRGETMDDVRPSDHVPVTVILND